MSLTLQQLLERPLGEVLEQLLAHRPEHATDASDWLDVRAPTFPVHWRRVVDAAKRDEVTISRIGRSLLVRRDELDRWLRTYAIEPTAPPAPHTLKAQARPAGRVAHILQAAGYGRASGAD